MYIHTDLVVPQGTIGRKMADLQVKDDQVQQAQNDVRSAQQSKAQMEQEVEKLNSQLEAKKVQYDQLMEQTKQVFAPASMLRLY